MKLSLGVSLWTSFKIATWPPPSLLGCDQPIRPVRQVSLKVGQHGVHNRGRLANRHGRREFDHCRRVSLKALRRGERSPTPTKKFGNGRPRHNQAPGALYSARFFETSSISSGVISTTVFTRLVPAALTVIL